MVRLHFKVPNKVMYTNWKGRTSERLITPIYMYWGETEYHPEPQWLLEAIDVNKGEIRHFALKDMTPFTSGVNHD